MAIQLPVEGGEGGKFLKVSKDITQAPRAFIIWKDPEYVKASSPKFGDDNGMQYKYYLQEGKEQYIMNSTSKRLAYSFNAAQVEKGDTVAISKIGSGFETQYTVIKIKSGNPLMDDDILPAALMRP